MKILILSTFPCAEPRHGGQHRVANIVRLLRDAGHQVTTAGVLGSDQYPQEEGYVPYPGSAAFLPYIKNSFLMEDWAIGRLFAQDDSYFKALVDCIVEQPDLIHVEHPWLFDFARRYVNEYSSKPIKLAYGSANIESDLKFGILKKYLGIDAAHDGYRKVLACELEALKKSDLVFCVSENDLEWSKNRTNAPVVLAQNGVRSIPVMTQYVRDACKITGHRKIALYCASAHPPNIHGFFDMFSAGIGALSPDERLVIAGSAGGAIRSDPHFSATAGLPNVFIDAGQLTDEVLRGLLHIAHVIILPITHGGGTNLKTAEALWAGRHIVATRTAMRGFEEFIGSHGVQVCESGPDFRCALRDAMASPPLVLSEDEKQRRRSVIWESTLHDLVKAVSALVKE